MASACSTRFRTSIWPPQGNIYVIDAEGNSIHKLDSQGQLLAKWGGFGAGDDQFSYPVAVVVDREGYIYVSDRNNDRIQKFRQE